MITTLQSNPHRQTLPINPAYEYCVVFSPERINNISDVADRNATRIDMKMPQTTPVDPMAKGRPRMPAPTNQNEKA